MIEFLLLSIVWYTSRSVALTEICVYYVKNQIRRNSAFGRRKRDVFVLVRNIFWLTRAQAMSDRKYSTRSNTATPT